MILEGLSEIAAAPQTAGMTDGCHGNLFQRYDRVCRSSLFLSCRPFSCPKLLRSAGRGRGNTRKGPERVIRWKR